MIPRHTSVILLSLTFLFLISCSNHKTQSHVDGWSKAILSGKTVESNPPATEFFDYSIPVPTDWEIFYVYAANPECSFCIASALKCYKAYLNSKTQEPFIFLLKSENNDLFFYYLKKEIESNPLTIESAELDKIVEGLYVIKDGRVVSHKDWEML